MKSRRMPIRKPTRRKASRQMTRRAPARPIHRRTTNQPQNSSRDRPLAEVAARRKHIVDRGEGARGLEGGPRLFDLHGPSISSQEFTQFQELIYRTAGIWLSHNKTALLVGRL